MRYFVLFLVFLGFIPAASAQLKNAIPSCYQAYGVEQKSSGRIERELLVLVDGTFDPDVGLKRTVHQKVHGFLSRGDRVSVVSFSSYGEERYTNIKFSGLVEAPPTQEHRNAISKKVLRKFDACMARQTHFVKAKVDEAIKASFKTPDHEVPYSEILGNLKQVLEPLVNSSPAANKVILLVSDMLENSDVTSFYRSNTVKKIDPEAEIEKVRNVGLVSNFGGAEFFVIGAGWVPQKYRGKTRGSKVMLALELFWQEYFEISGASLNGFGKPVLVQELALSKGS